MTTPRTTPTRSTPTRSTPTRSTSTIIRSARLLAVPAIAAGVLAAPPSAGARAVDPPLPPVACGTVITTDIRLTADLRDCAGSGLVVGAPGITIDLAGHEIDGTGSGAGIDNGAGHDDVHITRGVVRGFVFGVALFQADRARIDGVSAIGNLDGFNVASSARVDLDRVTARANVGPGIEITFSDQVTVSRSTASQNGIWGVVDRYSQRSRFVDNVLIRNTGPGLTVDLTSGAAVEGNQVGGNEGDGIELTSVEDASVVRNVVVFNRGNGISVDRAGTTIRANVAAANGGVGIAAASGTVDGGRNVAFWNQGGDCTGVTC